MANKRQRKEMIETASGLQGLRLKVKTSQSVFAAYLNTSVSMVQK